MKKLVVFIGLVVTLISSNILNVKAANYELKELIPIDVKTTVKTSNTTYKKISFTKSTITIEKIINLSYEEKNISISIGLFDKNHLNIGTIVLCDENIKLNRKESTENYIINIDKKYLGENNKVQDIKYISILSENETCRNSGYHDYLGQKVEEIGTITGMPDNKDTNLFIDIVIGIAVILVLIFLYNFVFTTKYSNIDNEDIRNAYKKEEKEKQKQRELEEKNKKPEEKIEEVVVKKEEEQTSLEDFYK